MVRWWVLVHCGHIKVHDSVCGYLTVNWTGMVVGVLT
jgi:hypothetical protein